MREATAGKLLMIELSSIKAGDFTGGFSTLETECRKRQNAPAGAS
jgi:hypothetical protein